MTIYDFVDISRTQLQVMYVPGAVSRWIANIDSDYHDVFCKEYEGDALASYPAGFGISPESAISDLVTKLRSYKILVVSPIEGKSKRPRQVYGIPSTLDL